MRLLISLAALVSVGLVAGFAVMRGGTLDLSALVYAIPIAAIAFALLAALINHAFLAPRPSAHRAAPRRNPLWGIVLGVVGLGAGGALFAGADREARAYAGDPTCSAALTVASSVEGACHVETAHIVDARRVYHRRSRDTYDLRLAGPSGTAHSVEVIGNDGEAMYLGVVDHDERSALLQFFGNRVTLVAAGSNRALTSDMPSYQVNEYAFIGIVGGLVGIWSALAATFRKT